MNKYLYFGLLATILMGYPTPFHARFTTIFAHGVLGNQYNVLWYAPPGNPLGWHVIETPYHSFNFPDVAPGKKDRPILSNLNIGQAADIRILNENVQYIITTRCTEPNDGIILAGYSRGAITILNYLAILSMKPPFSATDYYFYSILNLTTTERTSILRCIKAVILEAPTDTPEGFQLGMENLLSSSKDYASWLASWVPGKHFLFQKLSSYDPQGIHPAMVVQYIDKNIPLLFVHSEVDEVNNIKRSENLINILKNSGHTKVYFLPLKDGKHVKYNLGKDKDGYMMGVHAFYAKLGLPHDTTIAAKGLERLKS